MNAMTDEQLRQWQELCDKATAGPWLWAGTENPNQEGIARIIQGEWEHLASLSRVQQMIHTYEPKSHDAGHTITIPEHSSPVLHSDADAEFITTAREAMPALLAEVRRLRSLVKQ